MYHHSIRMRAPTKALNDLYFCSVECLGEFCKASIKYLNDELEDAPDGH